MTQSFIAYHLIFAAKVSLYGEILSLPELFYRIMLTISRCVSISTYCAYLLITMHFVSRFPSVTKNKTATTGAHGCSNVTLIHRLRALAGLLGDLTRYFWSLTLDNRSCTNYGWLLSRAYTISIYIRRVTANCLDCAG